MQRGETCQTWKDTYKTAANGDRESATYQNHQLCSCLHDVANSPRQDVRAFLLFQPSDEADQRLGGVDQQPDLRLQGLF